MEQERLDTFDNTLFSPPSDRSVKVWRYMDFTKFVALLNSGSLHLTRCDQFDDQFEGAFPEEDSQGQRDNYKDALINKARLMPDQLAQVLDTVWKKYQRQYMFINCWHMNSHESAALWNVYGATKEAIAIQTTYDRLRSVLPASYQIGAVRYIDHETYLNEEKEGFFSVMFKRKSFEHERELRVCYVDAYEFQQDVRNPAEFFCPTNARLVETVPVDLNTLVESVRIAPQTPDWFVKLVKDAVLRFGYNLPVSQSGRDDYPRL
ncbi:hypothetical protein [Spirosoma fluviale]|uniref:DUF2971 domain-containing protein n=1 Tax=Spirosoma fluviale TaxID=1597977 RepID=A0A286G916_9BACT|nr:hypothetical protein [Spirosoma fluviale]SOD92067.1 hypothetical protein SAMN06269250_3781 [Spirosoma fluviale]